MPPSHGGDQGFESPTGYQKPLTFAGWFFAYYFFSGDPTKRQRSQKPGFESPTGYQRPLTLAEWFFAYYFLFRGTNKTTAQPKAGVRIPYGLSNTTHIRLVAFCFKVVFPASLNNESPPEAEISKTTHKSQPTRRVLATKCSSRRIDIFMNSNNLRESY